MDAVLIRNAPTLPTTCRVCGDTFVNRCRSVCVDLCQGDFLALRSTGDKLRITKRIARIAKRARQA